MEKLKLKCKVIAIEAEKDCYSNLVLNKSSKELSLLAGYIKENPAYKPKHLYFVSDEKVKEGDWFIYRNKLYNEFKESVTPSVTTYIRKYPNNEVHEQFSEVYLSYCKKIVATTDISLGLPLIGNAFIAKYIKFKGDIDEVMLNVESYTETTYDGGIDISYPVKKVSVRDDNTVIISPVKSSWNRNEVLYLIEQAMKEGVNLTLRKEEFNEVHSKFLTDNLL